MSKNQARRRRPLRTGQGAEQVAERTPSRTTILNLLNTESQLMKAEQIADLLKVDKGEMFDDLRARLGRMEEDGELIRNRRDGYGLATKLDLIPGTILANAEGYGFLRPDADGEDLYLSPYEMRKVMHGDRVLASLVRRDRRGRLEGAIVSVMERRPQRLVGRFLQEAGFDLVVPDDRRLHQEVLIAKGKSLNAKPGDIVVCEITEPPSVHRQPVGFIARVLGDEIGPGLVVELAIETHGIPTEWPDDLQAELTRVPKRVTPKDKADRVDLRDLPLVTIDGEDARDFDDAIYCEPKGTGYRLIVAIADVSHYVRPGSALNEEAELRGTSVYFPQRVVPMLPEALSNEMCSLKPKVERLCMVCEMQVSNTGKVSKAKFYRGVMRSAARLTYNQVWQALGEGNAQIRKRLTKLLPHLENLYAMYQVMANARRARGALDFDGNEVKVLFGENGEIAAVEPYERNDVHKIIEECMIAANVAAARFLGKAKMPALYRVHGRPPARKYEDLCESFAELGFNLPEHADVTPLLLADVLRKARKRPDAPMIQAMLLRSLALAAYQSENDGHFGLALDAYAHFTSPIRRYPDLVVHRAIGWLLDGGKAKKAPVQGEELDLLGRDCSLNERRAEEASREVMERLKAQWMQQHIGGRFDGTVTGVASFGLFVELNESRVSGMIHVTQLPNDYYHFDAVRHALCGEREGLELRLADQVTVQVMRVDEVERKIDFKLVDGGRVVSASKRKRGKDQHPGRPPKSKSKSKGKRR